MEKMLDVKEVAALLGVSPKSVSRLVAAKKCPAPLVLGRLRRWNQATLEAWIAQGCPFAEMLRGLGRRRIFA